MEQMKNEKINFAYKMQHRLIYRLWTCMAVSVVPICAVSILLIMQVIFTGGKQLVASYQQQLGTIMLRMEQDTMLIGEGMDEFVEDYIAELNSPVTGGSEIILYDMLKSLEKVIDRSKQAGLVSLHDKAEGKTLISSVMQKAGAAETDALTREIRRLAEENQMPEDMARVPLLEKRFFVRRFTYRNYDVVFWLDMGGNIAERLAPFLQYSVNQIYVFGTEDDKGFLLSAGKDPAPIDLSWEECTREKYGQKGIAWEADTMPLRIYIRADIRGWQLVPKQYWFFVLVGLFCMCLIPFFWRLLKLEVLEPFDKLEAALKEIEKGRLDYRIEDHTVRNSDEVQYLFDSFDRMAEEMELSREKDKKMFQAEMDNLRLQVNPHMLLNSFNMIYSLAQSRNYTCIQDYALHLVDYFRYALRKNDMMVPLSQEIDFVLNYIEIQKIRYPKAFSCVYNIMEGCEKALVPPLLIENFVENAMKYALVPGKVIEVLLNIRRDGDRLLISVCDTGRGIKPEILEQLKKGEPYIDKMGNKHIGVWNCKRRIELFYEEKAEIGIVSNMGEGTQIFIDVPYMEEK